MFEFRNYVDYKEMPIFGKVLSWIVCPGFWTYSKILEFFRSICKRPKYLTKEL